MNRTPTTKPVRLLPSTKGWLRDNTGCVESGHCDDVAQVGIGVMLAGTSQGGLQKRPVAQSRRTAVNGYKAVVDRHHVAFLDPERIFFVLTGCHFASAWSVLR